MFIEINSTKGKMCVNVHEVLFVAETKKNTSTLVLTDGTMVDLNMTFEEVKTRLRFILDYGVFAPAANEK